MSAADPEHARRAPSAADPARLSAARTALAEAHRSTRVATAQMLTSLAPVANDGGTTAANEDAVRAPSNDTSRAGEALRVSPRGPVRCVPTGWPRIDRALGGGLARGSVVELTGALSSGRLSSAVAVLASALRATRDPVAFIDASDALDPRSFDEADRARVLWVRAKEPALAVRALDVLLDGGGFSLAVLYLAGSSTELSRERHRERARAAREDPREDALALAEGATPEGLAQTRAKGRPQAPSALWTRLAQRAARVGTVVLVVTDATESGDANETNASKGQGSSFVSASVVPGPGSFAHTRIATSPKAPRWYDGEQATFLDGRALGLRIERARTGSAGFFVRGNGGGDGEARPGDDAWLCAV
jgi:hypothetical protein